jgi:hypothetical protein
MTELTGEAGDMYRAMVARHVGDPNRGTSVHERRRRWDARIRRHLASGAWLFRSDVSDCYPSIGSDAVLAGLRGSGRGYDGELEGFLHTVIAEGTSGLPVGPQPSASLADAVLRIGDHAARGAGSEVMRWVDDVVFVAPKRRTAVASFDAWRAALSELGLEPHGGKTGWLESASTAAPSARPGAVR